MLLNLAKKENKKRKRAAATNCVNIWNNIPLTTLQRQKYPEKLARVEKLAGLRFKSSSSFAETIFFIWEPEKQPQPMYVTPSGIVIFSAPEP